MKHLKYSLIFMIITSSCNDFINNNNRIIPSQENKREQMVDSLGIRDLYNKTKWALYAFHCDNTLLFTKKSNLKDTVTFGELDLRIDSLILLHDSTEIDFRFYYNNLPCDINLVKNDPWWGILYNKNNSVIAYSSDGTLRYLWVNDMSSRYLNLEHPDVIKYINANKSKLNPWFLKEAERRGLIK